MRVTRSFIGAVLLSAALALPAAAETAPPGGSEDAERRLESARPWAYKRIDRAYDDLRAEQYADILETLDEMRRNPKLNRREQALMWQAYAYAHTAREDYPAAAAAMEACLAADGLERSATMQMRYNLAQIYVLLERPDDALREFDLWFAAAPNPSGIAYYMHAMAHVQKDNPAEALRLARLAVEKGGTEAREPWLQLVASLLIRQQDYAAAVPVIERLLERYPKKAYWLQLSAVYSGLNDSEHALAVLELADRQGLLSERSELMTLAQLYLYNQIPAKAAAVLERGLQSGVIAGDARSYQLLADSLLHARQRDAALGPLTRAAELSDSGNGWLRLAQIHLEREEWATARTALERAVAKGQLTSPGHAYLLLGVANANERRWQDAEQAFREAVVYEPVKAPAEHWLKHLAGQRAGQADAERLARGGAVAPPS